MKPSTRKWLFGAVAAAGVAAASAAVPGLEARRQADQLALPPVPPSVLPTKLATPLLAVGRAVLADVYWMLATRSKEQGRIFDAYQLARTICELQPRFASVWAFQAWNMAYNISVTLKTPEERWRWVRNGYELLRDQGIPLNPHNTQLYRELAWILYHKVGDTLDDHHFYYKLQFALQMEDILGPPPADYVRPGRVRDDYYREYDFAPLASAPRTLAEAMRQEEVAALTARLRPFGFDPAVPGVYLGLIAALREGSVRVPTAADDQQSIRVKELTELMSEPGTRAAREALEHFWRSYRLRNEVKLDPERIVDLQKGFGISFDWRLPHTHALYWANLGLEQTSSRQEVIDVHRLNTNRIEFYCLQKMFHGGRIAMSPNARLGEPPLMMPDVRMVPILFEAFQRDSKEYLERESVAKPVSENFRSGFVGFMRSAVLRYNELGMDREAREMFAFLREHFPDPMYEKGLDGFLLEQARIDRIEIRDARSAMARIKALLARGFVQLAYDEDEEGGRYLRRAKQVYDFYESDVVSDRLRIPFTYQQILEQTVHEIGGGMYRQSYERICRKLGLTPMPAGGDSAQPSS